MLDLPLGLTYGDVLLVPRRSRIGSRREVDTSTCLTRELKIAIPVLSANMDTVTEAPMAEALAREGGIGIIHRFMPIAEEAAQVARSEPQRSQMCIASSESSRRRTASVVNEL